MNVAVAVVCDLLAPLTYLWGQHGKDNVCRGSRFHLPTVPTFRIERVIDGRLQTEKHVWRNLCTEMAFRGFGP